MLKAMLLIEMTDCPPQKDPGSSGVFPFLSIHSYSSPFPLLRPQPLFEYPKWAMMRTLFHPHVSFLSFVEKPTNQPIPSSSSFPFPFPLTMDGIREWNGRNERRWQEGKLKKMKGGREIELGKCWMLERIGNSINNFNIVCLCPPTPIFSMFLRMD